MNEKIKQVLGIELSEQVEEALSTAGIEIGITNDGSLVPAEKHDGMKAELKASQEQLDKLQADLKGMENKEQTIEELKEQIVKAQEEHEQFKADTAKRELANQKKNAITKALEEAGAIKSSIDLLANTINLDELQIDKSGNIVDKESIVSEIKAEREGLFTTARIEGDKPPQGEGQVDDSELTDQEFFDKYRTKG